MTESTRTISDEVLTRFILRALERIPQECRNRYARRVDAMGAKLIASLIVGEMRKAKWTFEMPVRDPEASQSSYNRTAPGDR